MLTDVMLSEITYYCIFCPFPMLECKLTFAMDGIFSLLE